MSKQFTSIFLSGEVIDLPNFLTEKIIANYLNMIKKPLPNCPFWRKDIAQQNDFLMELSKRYSTELGGVKQLLKCFSGDVIAAYYSASKKTGFKLLKKENQMIILYELFKAQVSKKEVEPSLLGDIVVSSPAETIKQPSFKPSKSSISL